MSDPASKERPHYGWHYSFSMNAVDGHLAMKLDINLLLLVLVLQPDEEKWFTPDQLLVFVGCAQSSWCGRTQHRRFTKQERQTFHFDCLYVAKCRQQTQKWISNVLISCPTHMSITYNNTICTRVMSYCFQKNMSHFMAPRLRKKDAFHLMFLKSIF